MWTLLHISVQARFIGNEILLGKNFGQFSVAKPLGSLSLQHGISSQCNIGWGQDFFKRAEINIEKSK